MLQSSRMTAYQVPVAETFQLMREKVDDRVMQEDDPNQRSARQVSKGIESIVVGESTSHGHTKSQRHSCLKLKTRKGCAIVSRISRIVPEQRGMKLLQTVESVAM